MNVLYQKYIGGVWIDQPWANNLGSATVPVKNKMLGHDMANQGPACIAVTNLMSGTNYDVFTCSGSSFTASGYLNDLNAASATVVGTHGWPAAGCPGCIAQYTFPAFETGVLDVVASHDDINRPGVFQRRQLQIGSGLYHKNVTQQPPIFFTLHTSCSTGWTSHFLEVGFPNLNLWGEPWSTDQAFVGFAGLFNGLKSSVFITTYLQLMLTGRSAWLVRDKMIQDMNNDPFSPFLQLVNVNSNWEPMSVTNTRIWGDFAMRLKGVYQSDWLQTSTNWYL